MKRLIVMALVSGCAVWSLTAQDVDGRKGLSEDESAQRNVVVAKYDVDGDGVLSKSEQKALSKEEKKLLAKSGGVGTAKKASVQAEVSVKGKKGGAEIRTDNGSKPEAKARASKASNGTSGGKAKGKK